MELHPQEAERLAALVNYGVLDTEAEESFDRLTRMAATIFDTPIALVSLIDSKRQWFKSALGLDARETPREIAFCTHAILKDEVMVVPNASEDPRFASNPLVTGNPNIKFYAGAPLRTEQGLPLGTMCVIDRRPREMTARERQMLDDFAGLVMDALELRRLRRRLTLVEARH